jgi:periplasmic divalent cation tolerance protein
MVLVDLFITCADDAEANTILHALLNRRLIACGNTWPVSSSFRWEGTVERASEVMLLVKTTSDRESEAIALITELHSYDVPAISVVSVRAGSPEYERWVIESSEY